jgi:nucleoside-diphosphate-sugar epimerase
MEFLMSETANKKQQEIVLLGGSGFVGTHLIQKLLSYDDYSLSLLSHKTPLVVPILAKNVRLVNGNFFDEKSLDVLIGPGSIVINLAYLNNDTRATNVEGLQNVLAVCMRKRIKKFIHISTAVVAGRASALEINEKVVDVPFSEYEKTKLELEDLVVSTFSYTNTASVILRPTAVFGDLGKNAIKIMDEIIEGNLVKNYIKTCLFNNRRLNLLPVSYLVSAITFFIAKQSLENNDVFIVSADDEIDNNYQYVEQTIRQSLGLKNHLIPIIPVPKFVLTILLKLMGRSNIYPSRVYSAKKLKACGWKSEDCFRDAIQALSQSRTGI